MGHSVVTGSSGFIGSHLSRALTDAGSTVRAVDIRPPAAVSTSWRPVDITTDDLVPLLADADVVYHLAARPGVRSSWQAADDYVRTNVLGTQRVIDACLAAGVPRLVLTSSSSVYGECRGRPAREADPPNPCSPYAVTKLAAEQLALLAAGPRLAVVALRLFTVYGPGQRPDMMVARLLRAAGRDGSVRMFGSGAQARDCTYIDDVIGALLAASDSSIPSGVINVGTGRSTSLSELLNLAAAVTGTEIQCTAAAVQPGDVQRTQANIELAGSVLGYRPTVELADGLRRQWQFMAEVPGRVAGQTRTEEGSDAPGYRVVGE